MGQIVNCIDNLFNFCYHHCMLINRIVAKKIKKLFKQFPVISIVGPRQSGKTTLVRYAFQDMEYISLEDLDTREYASKDPRGFLLTYKNGCIIDEAQRVPELFSYIQTLVDNKRKSGQFVLTGSQHFLLQENISQTLAGRTSIIKLLPFSLEELKKASYKITDIDTFLFRGFYPRIYDKKLNPCDWYPNYIQTYIERDIRLIKNVSNLDSFQKFIKLCAGRIGQILNLSAIGNDCGITHNTAKSWISLLQTSFIVFLLKPHHKNFNKRLVKMPKLYFYDTGLACSLLGIENKKQLVSHYLRGSLFESFLISEIMKGRFNQGLEPRCYFWRDKTGHEIDCIIERAGSLIPIEIKAGKTIANDYFDGLKYWTKLSSGKKRNTYVVYGGDETQKRSIGNIVSWRNISSISM